MDLFDYARRQAGEADETPETPASFEQPIYTVGEITEEIKALLEGNFGGERIWVKGELSNYRGRNQMGHIYFSLKDEAAVLQCAFFRNANRNFAVELKDGLEVLCAGRLSVYPPRGAYQLIVEEIRAGGVGELYLRFEQLKKKLEAEGLFAAERKRPLPEFPGRIGLVTSATGAVVRDVIHVVKRRCPFVTLLLFPVKVQGEGAAEEIAAAVAELNRPGHRLDLLIVGRGGGSIEDLWAFNEEAVARAIASSRLPVISAVGHQADFTIADFVADVRAATPSQAGELAVPDADELRRRVGSSMRAMARELVLERGRARERLAGLRRSPFLSDPRVLFRNRRQRTDLAVERMMSRLALRRERGGERFRRCRSRLRLSGVRLLEPKKLHFGRAASNLDLLNPLAVLSRGFSVVSKPDGTVVRSSEQVGRGDPVSVRLHEGRLACRVSGTFRS